MSGITDPVEFETFMEVISPWERRFLLLPGLRSSHIHVYDTKPDPTAPRLYKTIEAKELAERAGYSRPHTLHCGPDGVFLTCLGAANGDDGPGGIALLDGCARFQQAPHLREVTPARIRASTCAISRPWERRA